jgi:hypothetical protein
MPAVAFLFRSAAIALALAAAACAKVDPHAGKPDSGLSPSANDDSRNNDDDGRGGGGGDVAQVADVVEVAIGPTEDGPNCGVSMFALDRVPPDVLILLDRSGSMAAPALDSVR